MTSRRLLLLVGGLGVFGLAYSLYARFFGWLDGLPVLPPRYLTPASGEFRPPEQPTTPTLELLKAAFGEHSLEVESVGYPTRLAFRRGDTALVVACGRPPAQPDSHRVTVAPFSAAVFGKPRPPHLLQPGEVVEIATFHADKAVLEFDRVIRTPNDMNEARLVRLELISDPEAAVTPADPRVGMVHITHNQRSSDPNRWLVLRTPGPVFYRDSRTAGNAPTLGPDIWTDAVVEIVDRANLPRPEGAPVRYAVVPSADMRQPAVAAAILAGRQLPPPTVTAVGLRVYLQPRDAVPSANKPTNARSGDRPPPFSGLRRVELLEQVRLHLWMEAGGAVLVGGRNQGTLVTEQMPAWTAACGGLLPAHHQLLLLGRELLQVETRGPFLYDAEKNVVRFEVLPQVDPHLPNDVQVTRITPGRGIQSLFTQVLELELDSGKSTSPAAAASAEDVPTPPKGMVTHAHRVRRLHAWTYTPGRILTISSEIDQLHATGTDLVYDAEKQRTTLTGAPLIAVHQRHVLTAGTTQKPAEFIWEPDYTTPAAATATNSPSVKPTVGPRTETRHRVTIKGPGRVEMHDPDQDGTATACWQEMLTHAADPASGTDSEVLTLMGAACYEDRAADYRLQADTIRLWIMRANNPLPSGLAAREAGHAASPTARTLPQRIQALGHVQGHSPDFDIEQTDQLNVLIRDVTQIPAKGNAAQKRTAIEERGATRVTPPQQSGSSAVKGHQVMAVPSRGEPPAPLASSPVNNRKQPFKIRARTIDTWLIRGPEVSPVSAMQPRETTPERNGQQRVVESQPAGAARVVYRYALERARCEGTVFVHQDPQDPTRTRGTDIHASLLLIDQATEGSILTVYGWDNRPGEVHHEGTSLIGPWIKIDQVHNLAIIEGRGSMAVPATTDLAGNTLAQAEPIVIHFRDGMTFKGALKTAEFFGKVSVAQGDSGLTCHTMRVIFDRPVYFTAMRSTRERSGPTPTLEGKAGTLTRPAEVPQGAKSVVAVASPAEESPRIESVHCYPCPADSAEHFRETLVYFHQVERDPKSGRLLRQQQLEAQELTLLAQARDGDQGAPYRFLEAHGPGVVRIWGLGANELAAVPSSGGQPSSSAQAEMQLTIVHFSRRMIAKDKGRAYKEATFYDNVQVVHVPTDDPHLEVKRAELPPRAVLLTCQSRLVVWTYRRGDEPPRQHMHAYGNAYLQSEEYAGSGEIIKNDGKLVTFEGSGAVPARIRRRFRGDEQTAQRIIYDRATQQFTVEGSLGGAILAPASSSVPNRGTLPRNPASKPPPLP